MRNKYILCSTLVVSLTLLALLTSGASDLNFSENVKALDADVFNGYINAKESVLVMFYAPWCGHCTHLAPTISSTADKIAEDPSQTARVARVNCDENEPLCDSQLVDGYPTLYHYKNGVRQPEVYERDIEELFSLVTGSAVDNTVDSSNDNQPQDNNSDDAQNDGTDQTADSASRSFWSQVKGADSVVKLTPETYDAAITSKEKTIVMFYAPWCGHCNALRSGFAEAASLLEKDPTLSPKSQMAAVDCELHPTLCSEITSYPTLKGYPTQYSGSRKVPDFLQFFGAPKPAAHQDLATPEQWNAHTHVTPLTEANFEDSTSSAATSVVMFYAPWCSHCQKLKPHFADAAEGLKDDPTILFGNVDCTDPAAMSLCDKYDIEGYPTVFRFINGVREEEYSGPRDAAGLIAFGKNELLPIKELWLEAGNVKALTPNTISSYTETPEKATIIMFKADWCPHCHLTWPEFVAASEAHPEVNWASVECTHYNHLCDQFELSGYPTILVWSPGADFPYEFSAGRTQEFFSRLAVAAAEGKASPDAAPELGKAVPVTNAEDLTVWTRAIGSTDDYPGIIALMHKDDRKSQNLLKTWEKTAGHALDKGINTRFITVDCSEGSPLAEDQACTTPPSFPAKTIFSVRMLDGMIVASLEVPEANDVDALLFQAHRVETAQLAHITNKEELRVFKNTDRDWPKPRSQPQAPAILAVVANDGDELLGKASIFKDHLAYTHYMGYMYQRDAEELLGRPSQDKSYLIVFRDNDEPEIVPDELVNADHPAGLLEFFKLATVPNIFEANELTKKLLKPWPEVPLFILFTRADTKEETAAAMDAVREVMPEYRGKLFVGFVDGVFAPQIPSRFGFDFDTYPDIGYATGGTNPRKFRMDPDLPITADNLRAFFNAYLEDKLEPYRLSAPLPETPKIGNITVLVGDTYEKVVSDPTKNVFVELYDPACMFCKDLVPRWNELADHFADVEDVIIAAMDITENDAGVKEIERTPTVYWYPAKADEKFGYLYDGDFWETQSFINYINERRVAISGEPDAPATDVDEAAAAAALGKAAKKAFAS